MTDSVPTPEQLLNQTLVAGMVMSRAVTLAAEVGIADLLKDGPRSAAWIASQLNIDPDATHRLLRTLTVSGVFEEIASAPGHYALTAISQLLCNDHPESLRPLVRRSGLAVLWRAYAHADHTLRTGRSAFEKETGTSMTEYFAEHGAEGKLVDEAMERATNLSADLLAERYDFSAVGTLVDVGGGTGASAIAIAKRYPSIKAVLFELPRVAAHARVKLSEKGWTDRISVESGSFFDRVPAGADVYLLKSVLSLWSDEGAMEILRRCREALLPEGRILVVNEIMGDGPESAFTKVLDFALMLGSGGRHRTQVEFSRLFDGCGLRLSRVIPLGALSVMEVRAGS